MISLSAGKKYDFSEFTRQLQPEPWSNSTDSAMLSHVGSNPFLRLTPKISALTAWPEWFPMFKSVTPVECLYVYR
jgi:hypothetical protein